jgi:hypothetical protein
VASPTIHSAHFPCKPSRTWLLKRALVATSGYLHGYFFVVRELDKHVLLFQFSFIVISFFSAVFESRRAVWLPPSSSSYPSSWAWIYC